MELTVVTWIFFLVSQKKNDKKIKIITSKQFMHCWKKDKRFFGKNYFADRHRRVTF